MSITCKLGWEVCQKDFGGFNHIIRAPFELQTLVFSSTSIDINILGTNEYYHIIVMSAICRAIGLTHILNVSRKQL